MAHPWQAGLARLFREVPTLDAPALRRLLAERPPGSVAILDVRTPAEYARGHLPGAKLVPLADLQRRMGELDLGKPTVVT